MDDALRNSPKACLKKKPSTLQYLFNLESRSNDGRKSSLVSKKEDFFCIIKDCNLIFTFTDPSESPSQLDLKKRKLTQLFNIIKSSKEPLNNEILPQLVSMLSTNLFRPFPPPSNSSTASGISSDEGDAATPAPGWSHLQIVYDMLLLLVLNTDPMIFRDYIDHSFILKLLSLFQSKDPWERKSLQNVFHWIYLKFRFYRSFMRKSMNEVLLHYIYETEQHHCGIIELLEIWRSIINGFTVPLKSEHKQFLMTVLVPLHKPKGFQDYHLQLGNCISEFLQKDPGLTGDVVSTIFGYWPLTCCHNEFFLLKELERLLKNIDPELHMKLALPLYTQIARCLNSGNSQVAELALRIWNNEQFVMIVSRVIVSRAVEDVLPLVVEGLEKNMELGRSKHAGDLMENIRVLLEKMEPNLYTKCLHKPERGASVDCQ